ncbi:hypothetical protein L1887_32407 [Cichorium endivia]|nr:hypothetical protein L1887_32407 [Cichorium endivia]
MRENRRVSEGLHGTARGNLYRGNVEYRQPKASIWLQGKVVSYMFFNFPMNTTVEKLWSLFRRFGKVVDMYMAKKKLRNGREFGFVRFSQVEDPNKLGVELNGVWIGLYKLRVFLARSKEGQKLSDGSYGDQGYMYQVKKDTTRDDRTYQEVVQGMKIRRNLSEGLKEKPKMEEGLEWLEVEIDRCPVLEEKLTSSLIGCVKEGGMIENLDQILYDLGLINCRWRFMGGLDVLLECSSKEEAEGIVSNKQHGLREWMKEILFWSPEHVVRSRLTWIKLYGLPVDAWSGRNFHKIASIWGSVIKLENCEFESATSLVAGGWWLAAGGWWLVAGGWRLVAGGWWLVAGGWWLVAGGWWLVAGGWWLVAGGWWLVAGGWWLVAGGWWLVAGGWWLVEF